VQPQSPPFSNTHPTLVGRSQHHICRVFQRTDKLCVSLEPSGCFKVYPSALLNPSQGAFSKSEAIGPEPESVCLANVLALKPAYLRGRWSGYATFRLIGRESTMVDPLSTSTDRHTAMPYSSSPPSQCRFRAKRHLRFIERGRRPCSHSDGR
jgi:hypothetical protein